MRHGPFSGGIRTFGYFSVCLFTILQGFRFTMDWSVIAAVNDEQVLKSCLLGSPDLESASEVVLKTGFSSAAQAYNLGIRQSSGEIMVFVHQDVCLPEGWWDSAQRAVKAVETQDKAWGVLGVWGATHDGGRAGYLHWTGIEGAAGGEFEGGIEVQTLDELLLIVRRGSGLTYDEHLPGYHMYGADICLEAARRGMKSYAISAFCIHNTNEYKLLPVAFWKAYLYMRRKWISQLPIETTCTKITRYCRPMIWWNFVHSVNLALGRKKVRKRIPDPGSLYL